ncbi:MAG: hypothetical protein HDP34_06095 [Clostridia bacterium]|nr:hypothetical protein [Clostridia bacterium]
MGKKNKIKKITDEQYLQYIAGLKNDAALFNANGDLSVPDAFVGYADEEKDKQGE